MVVTVANIPAAFTPRRLTSTTTQMALSVSATAMVRLCSRGHHVDERTGEGEGDRRQRCPDGDPVAPGDEEAGEVAIGHARVRVGAARLPARCVARRAKVSPRQMAPAPITIHIRMASRP